MASLTIAQPDHPTPDRQLTEGFSLEAVRRNDEYGLIAAPDGHALPFAHAVELAVGFSAAPRPDTTRVTVHAQGIHSAAVLTKEASWTPLPVNPAGNALSMTIPDHAVSDDATIRIRLFARDEGRLDAITAHASLQTVPAPWKPPARKPRAYALVSDHTLPANLVANPAFAHGRQHWTLEGDARVDAPFSVNLPFLEIVEGRDRRVARVESTVTVRPYDLITVTDSDAGNNGNYRVRSIVDSTHLQFRRPAKAPENGLSALLNHDFGCALVSPGTCLVLRDGATAAQDLPLSGRASALKVSAFHRAYDPSELGTRDLPRSPAVIGIRFKDFEGTIQDTQVVLSARASWQWRKLTHLVAVPGGATAAQLTLHSPADGTCMVTGVYVGPVGPH